MSFFSFSLTLLLGLGLGDHKTKKNCDLKLCPVVYTSSRIWNYEKFYDQLREYKVALVLQMHSLSKTCDFSLNSGWNVFLIRLIVKTCI